MTYDNNNIFAKIIRKEIPSKVVYEDDYVLSFHDIAPLTPIHVLVIPKGAYIDFSHFQKNASKDELIGFYNGVQSTIDALSLGESYRLLTNKGDLAGQTVPHYHVHILSGCKMGTKVMAD